jgi:hypothetical protein
VTVGTERPGTILVPGRNRETWGDQGEDRGEATSTPLDPRLATSGQCRVNVVNVSVNRRRRAPDSLGTSVSGGCGGREAPPRIRTTTAGHKLAIVPGKWNCLNRSASRGSPRRSPCRASRPGTPLPAPTSPLRPGTGGSAARSLCHRSLLSCARPAFATLCMEQVGCQTSWLLSGGAGLINSGPKASASPGPGR